MANHPISLVSPVQIIQASMAHNNNTFVGPEAMLPPTGLGDHPNASVNVPAGSVVTDNYAMQANDQTAFLFGPTADNRSATPSDYTTVDDTAKLVSQAAIDNDVIDKVIRDAKRKKKKNATTEEEDATNLTSAFERPEEAQEEETESKNSILVASYGRV
ncbi:MAG: hypothetical protein K2W99_02935 [Chthoniobacterales bacterium]|nr:hypothetical protein [Chthoniobacterales bacterium]